MDHDQIEILKAEITDDPLSRGYSGMNDLEVAGSLNTVNRPVTKTYLTGSEIFNATDYTEYGALTSDQQASWDRLCGVDQINISSGIAKGREAELFGPGSVTRAALVALKVSPQVSRGTELGLGTVYEGNVQEARA